MGPQQIRIDVADVRFNPQTGKPEVRLVVTHTDLQTEAVKVDRFTMWTGESIHLTINPVSRLVLAS